MIHMQIKYMPLFKAKYLVIIAYVIYQNLY